MAQSFTASVRGVVTDASHSAIPQAKITVTDVSRNLEHTAVSDASGRFQITALPPGSYSLTAEAAGFKRYQRNAFELAKEINRPSEVIDNDSYVVHPFERHVSSLQSVV